MNKSPIAILFIKPKSLIPKKIQANIKTPITTHHTQFPKLKIPFTARAPS